MPFCNVIIYSYHYLLDPKIAERVSKELSKDCIVVFDEAHNIDNVCIESLSIDLTEDSLRKATRGANNLERKITEMRSSDAEKLRNEYSKLVEGLRDADEARDENAFMANPGRSPASSSPCSPSANDSKHCQMTYCRKLCLGISGEPNILLPS